MTSALTRRLEALEALQSTTEGRAIILIGAVMPGQPEAPVTAIACGGQRWERQDGETVEALRQRAASECRPNAWGVALLVECTAPA
jgi:hypothetical protein